jgi:hypothetical protein
LPRPSTVLGLGCVLWLATGCCCPPTHARALAGVTQRESAAPLQTPTAISAAAADSVTEAEFRDVDFHVAPGVVLGIRHLRGRMLPTPAGSPVIFDDKTSFTIELTWAEVALDTSSLAHLMNEHVFHYRGAPLRDLSFSTRGNELVQRGILHKVVDIPFEIRAGVSLTPDGMIRVHPTSMRICSIDGTGLMKALRIDLSDLLDARGARGVRVDGNDLLLDADELLPPPRIRGRLTSVRVEPGRLVQVFGDSATAATLPVLAAPPSAAANYMYFRGGTLRFGKLFMVRSDMRILDLDPGDSFDFSIDQYEKQLVAGYSRTRPDLGLDVFMPDLAEVESGGIAASAHP